MQKDNQKFTLEDMLSIKKAEKPSAQEWENFNAQLKSKMLKSLVAEKKEYRFFFSPLSFAKLGALSAVGLLLAFVFYPRSVENISLQSDIELVQIPNISASYYSDTYLTANSADTEYAKDSIQSFSNTDVVYATNDLLAFNNLAF